MIQNFTKGSKHMNKSTTKQKGLSQPDWRNLSAVIRGLNIPPPTDLVSEISFDDYMRGKRHSPEISMTREQLLVQILDGDAGQFRRAAWILQHRLRHKDF